MEKEEELYYKFIQSNTSTVYSRLVFSSVLAAHCTLHPDRQLRPKTKYKILTRKRTHSRVDKHTNMQRTHTNRRGGEMVREKKKEK